MEVTLNRKQGTAMAFVPSLSLAPSAFVSVQKHHARICPSTKQTSLFGTRPTSRALVLRPAIRRASSAALQMNLFERFFRLIRSTLNGILTPFESPEKILEQTTIDMQNDLQKVRQAYAEVAATAKKIARQRDQAAQLSNDWYARANLALRKGDEELAREALIRKTQQDEQVKTLSAQYETMQKNVAKLADSIVEIESKINEARATKDELIARARTARTTAKVNNMLSGLDTSSGMAAFDQMREKVEALEAQAEVAGQAALGMSRSLDAKFRELESSSSVDQQLEELRRSLPQNRELRFLNPAVESQLEALKREQGYF